MSALVVTERVTYRGGAGYDTPPGALDGTGIASFLDWVVRAVAGVGVVLVDKWAAGRLQLPVDALPSGGEGKRHPAAAEARKAGWSVDEVWRWTRFRRTGHEVHIGLLDLIDPAYCPLIARSGFNGTGPVQGLDTSGAFDTWQDLAGVPYAGAPGDAVNLIIQQTAKCTLNRRPLVPSWKPRPPDVGGAYARTFRREGFDESGQREGRWLVGYDATRAYLAAMTSTEVAPLPLRPTGRLDFDPGLAGWWLVDLAPWRLAGLPAPWGYYPGGEDVDGHVWLTTPDLALLAQLRDANRYAGFTIIDSYTSRSQRGVLRPAAERLRHMWQGAGHTANAQDGAAVRAAIAAGYKAAHGTWRSDTSTIRRPDWAATLVATARTNTWRRLDAAAAAGWHPAYVDGIDTIYYATDTPERHTQQGIPGIVTDRYPLNTGGRTDQLGTFRAKYVIDREETT